MQRSSKRALIGAGVVVALGALAFTLLQPFKFQGHGLEELKLLVPDGLQLVYESALKSYKQYRTNAGRWSAVYFGSVFGAALCSAAAGVILKLENPGLREDVRKDVAAALAAAGALLITLSTLGNFEGKWRANRLAGSRMEAVLYELAKPDADRAEVLDQLKAINLAFNESIVASEAPGSAEGGAAPAR